jgi:hypothetical protein
VQVGIGGTCSAQGQVINAYNFWFGSLKEKEHSEDIGVDGRITFLMMNLRVP